MISMFMRNTNRIDVFERQPGFFEMVLNPFGADPCIHKNAGITRGNQRAVSGTAAGKVLKGNPGHGRGYSTGLFRLM